MARRERPPQEKKRLSLARDSVIRSGEAPHALRRHWGKQKRAAERARRTAERVGLATDAEGFARVRRRTVRKWGVSKLAEAIAGKQERRAALQETPRKSAATRLRRAARRSHAKGVR
jgi:hypothetical protein